MEIGKKGGDGEEGDEGEGATSWRAGGVLGGGGEVGERGWGGGGEVKVE